MPTASHVKSAVLCPHRSPHLTVIEPCEKDMAATPFDRRENDPSPRELGLLTQAQENSCFYLQPQGWFGRLECSKT